LLSIGVNADARLSGWGGWSYLKENRMPRLHSTVLLDIALEVAEAFRTDPAVAELLDPAVFIGADEDDCAAAVVERLQLAEVMSGMEITQGSGMRDQTSNRAPIAVLVMDQTSATIYSVPDPRTDPELWPWTASREQPLP
jgi:hypothetical protein